MVNISNDFNDELDRYIEKRRSAKPFYKDILKQKKKQDYASSDKEEGRKMIFGFLRRRIPTDEEIQEKLEQEKMKRQEAQMDQQDQMEPEEEFYEEEPELREGPVKRLVRKLFFTRVDEEYEEMPEEIQEEDETQELKETIKVLHRWLEKLPPEQITAFKNSEDFEKYKEALKKLGLTK